MKSKWVIVLVLAGLTVAAVAVVIISRLPPEPAYRGKPLMYWMTNFGTFGLVDRYGETTLGTNAIPFLARALRIKESPCAKIHRLYDTQWPRLVGRCLPQGRTKFVAMMIRSRAAAALQAFRAAAEPARPALHAAINDEDYFVRGPALSALNSMPPTEESIPFLLQVWTNNYSPRFRTNSMFEVELGSRVNLIASLSRVSHCAPKAIAAVLIEALDDPAFFVKTEASRAFNSPALFTPPARSKLVQMLSSGDVWSRRAAVHALGNLGHVEPDLLPLFRARFEDDDVRVRASAARALWKMTGDSTSALRRLTGLLGDDQGRGLAAEYLGEMGSVAKEAVPSLIKAAQTQSGYPTGWLDRLTAAEAILEIAGQSDFAVSVLIEAVTNYTGHGCVATARAAARIGPAAKAVIPAMEQVLNSRPPDSRLEHELKSALATMKGEPDSRATQK